MKKEKKYNSYSNIILTIVVTIALFFAITSTTFTYYLIKLQKYNTKDTSLNIGILTFDRDNLIEYYNYNDEKNKLNFSLTNSSNTKIKYNVYFNIIENTIVNDNLVYLTNGTSGENSGNIIIKYGNMLDEYKKEIDSTNTVGYIPSNDNKILIGCGEIGSFSTDEWNFKIWLNEENNILEGMIKGYISIETN